MCYHLIDPYLWWNYVHKSSRIFQTSKIQIQLFFKQLINYQFIKKHYLLIFNCKRPTQFFQKTFRISLQIVEYKTTVMIRNEFLKSFLGKLGRIDLNGRIFAHNFLTTTNTAHFLYWSELRPQNRFPEKSDYRYI